MLKRNAKVYLGTQRSLTLYPCVHSLQCISTVQLGNEAAGGNPRANFAASLKESQEANFRWLSLATAFESGCTFNGFLFKYSMRWHSYPKDICLVFTAGQTVDPSCLWYRPLRVKGVRAPIGVQGYLTEEFEIVLASSSIHGCYVCQRTKASKQGRPLETSKGFDESLVEQSKTLHALRDGVWGA